MNIQNKFKKANVTYKITKDYDLEGGTLIIPVGCTLDFLGGSFKNGIIVGNNTTVCSYPKLIFNNITLSGTFNLDDIYIEWFLNDESDATNAILTAIDFASNNNGAIIKLLNKTYIITDTIYIKAKVSIIGCRPQGRNNDKASVFDCKFKDSNKWAFDCKYTDTELADYNDIFCSKFKNVSPPVRIWNIQLQNFSIINNSDSLLYGGVRLFSTLYSNVTEISIYGTIFGISAASVWDFIIDRCFIHTQAFAVCFGPVTTYATCKDVYCTKLKLNNRDYVTPIVADDTVPAWKEENLTLNDFTSAILINSANVTLYNTIVENYQFVCLSSNPTVLFDSLYVENIDRIVSANSVLNQGVTTYYIIIQGNKGGNYKKGQELYSYSAVNCQIKVKDFYSGTCYEPVRNGAYNGTYYIFDISNPGYDDAFFYSDSDNTEKSRVNINLLEKVYINLNDNVSASNWGYYRRLSIPFSEVIKRYEKATIYGNGDVLENSFINNKNFKFVNPINSELRLYNPITICNSTLDFEEGKMSLRNDKEVSIENVFDTIGNNIVKFSYNPVINFYFKAIAPSFIKCYFLTYSVSVKNKVMSSNSKYPIYIEVYVNNEYVETITNTRGVTNNRPTNPIEGFQYFDTTLNKYICWDGTEWINLDGTPLT